MEVFEDFNANLSTENHGQVIMQRLEEQRATKLCDVIVLSSDRRKYPCHKAILAANSTLLRDKVMKSSKIQTEFPSHVLKPILDYFYSGSVRIEESNCIELLDASISLLVTPLENAISHYIQRTAKDNLRQFLESEVMLKVPPNLMRNAVGDILIANGSHEHGLLLQVVEALANWAGVDHGTRWVVYRELLERVKNTRFGPRQVPCTASSFSSLSSVHLAQSGNQPMASTLRRESVDFASAAQSTPLESRRSRERIYSTTSQTEDAADMYVELELARNGQGENDRELNPNQNSKSLTDSVSGLVEHNGTTLSQYERQIQHVIDELRARRVSSDENIKL